MNTTQKLTLANYLIVLIAIVAILILVLMRLDTYLRHQAIDSCAQISRYEFDNGQGVRTVEPIKALYEACLKEKGL